MLNSININGTMVNYFVPAAHDVNLLSVGDLALDCFGRWSKVTEIFGTGTDKQGREFVCFYTKHGENGQVSQSYKRDELVRTVALSAKHTSHELDDIERDMLRRAA